MPHRFATDVEEILSALPSRPLIAMRVAMEDVRAALPAAKEIAVVSDANTHAALGERVERMLATHYKIKSLVLPGTPSPDMQTLAALNIEYDALAAVGSGTINDLCKYASHTQNKPYIVFPTAPSMNGYTSANASIIEGGKKQSHAAHLPAAVLCDMEVITAAPIRLIRAGLGDSLARSTAQADWLLSHVIKGTPYDERPFALLAPYEPELLESASALGRGDKSAVMKLMEVLLLSGFGMTLAGGSFPASQGEHMIAHTYKSRYGAGDTLHGEQIGVTALTMARVQESVIARIANGNAGAIHPSRRPYGPPQDEEPHGERPRQRRLEPWPPLEFAPQIREMTSFMLPSSRIETILNAAGCPTTPQELGWNEAHYAEAIKQAPFSRDRFTFLSLVSS